MATLKEFRELFKRSVTFPATKVDYWTFRKLRALKVRDVGFRGWADWFKHISRDVNLEPTLAERVQEGTRQVLLQTWMHNFGDNMPNVRYGDHAQYSIPEDYKQTSILDLVEYLPMFEDDPDYDKIKDVREIGEIEGMKVKNPPLSSAIVVGRGPSLFQHGHLQMLHEAIEKGEYKGMVIASDGGLIPCLENGVVPDVVVSVDGAPTIKKWFDHPLVHQYGKNIKWIASVTIHHSVYLAGRAAGMTVYWFMPTFDDWRQIESWTRLERLLSTTPEYPNGIPAMNSGGNAGAAAWIVAMEIFKRSPIALIGIDFGYPEGTPIEQTHYYDKMLEEAKGDVNLIKKAYPQFYHPTFKTKAYVDFIFYHYRQAFIQMQKETALWYRLYGGTVNCTEGGTLFGYGIKCMTFKDFLEKWIK